MRREEKSEKSEKLKKSQKIVFFIDFTLVR